MPKIELSQSQYKATDANTSQEKYEFEANVNNGPLPEKTPPGPIADFIFVGGVKNTRPCRVVHPHHFSIITPPPPPHLPNLQPQTYLDTMTLNIQNRERLLIEREQNLNEREQNLIQREENLSQREASAMAYEQTLYARENNLRIPICRDCQRSFPPPYNPPYNFD